MCVENMVDRKVESLGKIEVFKTRRFTVLDSKLRIKGKVVTKPYIHQNNCSEILAITKEGKVVLVRSYRSELDRYVYELPAGTLKDGENPKSAAKRELLEETGYAARKMEPMFSSYPLLGYSDCKLYFFLATNLEKKKQNLEDDESITLGLFKPKEVLKLLKNGKIVDMSVLTAIHYYYLVLKQGITHVKYKDPH